MNCCFLLFGFEFLTEFLSYGWLWGGKIKLATQTKLLLLLMLSEQF